MKARENRPTTRRRFPRPVRMRWIVAGILAVGLGVVWSSPPIWYMPCPGHSGVAITKCKEYLDLAHLYMHFRHVVPRSLDALCRPLSPGSEPLVDALEPDPWGNPFTLVGCEPGNLRVVSAGKDGRFGTDDDIAYPPDSCGDP